MPTGPSLREDHHVHSTFSDGAATLAENIARAEALGLVHLGCVDHVRRDTTYVPLYAAAVRDARPATALTLTVGIEAKLLDATGALDVPAGPLPGVDLVYAADHVFPWDDGPRSPRVVREWVEGGRETPEACLLRLHRSLVGAMRAGGEHPLVLAHLFSLLPKSGLGEAQVRDEWLEELAETAAATGTTVEISERWRCPSVRALGFFRRAGVRIVCSTDSHALPDLGRYAYVAACVAELGG